MKYSKTLMLLVSVIALSLVTGISAAEKVKAWEDTITLPTYPWGPDNPNPRFNEYEKSIIYPYTMQDNLSSSKVDRQYQTLCLENEYLKAVCIPELGGRIHSVLDKTTGEEMFHLNHVIKPGLIAMRGGWISGGIEWNTGPHGHTVSIISPVDAIIVENEDGSASLVIGNTEKIFRTRWNVLFTLRPGRAFLEEKIDIYNPTDTPHPYYFWNNTAFPCDECTRYMYPMTLGTDHFGATFYQWPMNEGRDMTWLKNYPNMTSIFSYGCVYDFFGAYHVGKDRGIVQFADHRILPGKKAWTWGQSDFGIVSQESLTDSDGPYIEVQSGPLATQSDYEFLPPHRRVAWEEWWYPVHGLGDGFEYATKDIAFQTYRRGVTLEVRLAATGEFPAARLAFYQEGKLLGERTIDLTPLAPKTVNVDATGPVAICLQTADGASLASYTTPLPIPRVDKPELPPAKAEGELSAEEKYQRALRLHKDTDKAAARQMYEEVLAQDPNHAGALRDYAVLELESGLNDKALAHLTMATANRPDDSLAWALMGVAQLNTGQYAKALDTAYRAVRLADAAALGFDVAGRANMKMKRFSEAADDFVKAIEAAPHDARARDHYLLALVALGQQDKALAFAAEYSRDNPLAVIPRVIPALDDFPRLRETMTQVLTNMGEDEFELLDAACVCTEAAMPEVASQMLSAAPESGRSAITMIHLSHLAGQYGEQDLSNKWLEQALAQSPDCVFPSFPESLEPLRAAIERQPANGKLYLYQGNLLAGLGRIEEAVASWEKAAQMDNGLSVAYRNLAMNAWKKDNDLPRADECFAKAIEARPDDEILYRDRAQLLIELKRQEEAIQLLERRPLNANPRTDAAILLAKTYVDQKRYQDALTLLERSSFDNWEGQMDSWNLFNRSHVELGKVDFDKKAYQDALDHFSAALTYPKNLRVGRPVSPKESEAQYWKGRALRALDRSDEAVAAWKLGAEEGAGKDDADAKFRDKCKNALELLEK